MIAHINQIAIPASYILTRLLGAVGWAANSHGFHCLNTVVHISFSPNYKNSLCTKKERKKNKERKKERKKWEERERERMKEQKNERKEKREKRKKELWNIF